MASQAEIVGAGGELRCSKCEHKVYQCFSCQNRDKQKRAAASASKKTAAKQPPRSPLRLLQVDAEKFMATFAHAHASQAAAFAQQNQAGQIANSSANVTHPAPKQQSVVQDELNTCLVFGLDLEMKQTADKGRGIFIMVPLRKGQRVADYMGNRYFKDGIVAMECHKMRDLISHFTPVMQSKLKSLKHDATWSINVSWTNNKGTSAGALTSINGGISACWHLDLLKDRGGIGVAALANSSKNTGVKPTCKIVWIKRDASTFTMCNAYQGLAQDCYDAVLVALRDMAVGEVQCILWYDFSQESSQK
jgi:hypothetical protein